MRCTVWHTVPTGVDSMQSKHIHRTAAFTKRVSNCLPVAVPHAADGGTGMDAEEPDSAMARGTSHVLLACPECESYRRLTCNWRRCSLPIEVKSIMLRERTERKLPELWRERVACLCRRLLGTKAILSS
jgi:hypothetical protein